MTTDSRFTDDDFVEDLTTYLGMVGGPNPEPISCNTRSHWVLLRLNGKYGKNRVKHALDLFFADNPNW